MGDEPLITREEKHAMEYADTSLELVQNIFERVPSRYGFEDFDDVANKNLVVANLSRKAGEPEMIMKKADNIITYKRFKKQKPVFKGWKKHVYESLPFNPAGRDDIIVTHTKNGVIILEPIFEIEPANRFKTLMDEDLAFIQTLTGVSAGTDASVLQLMRSTFIQKDQTVEDRTAPRKGLNWKRE